MPVAVKPGAILYCCERAVTSFLAYQLYDWKKAIHADALATALKREEVSALGGVGLTPHATAVDRALAAIYTVNQAIDKMAAAGPLRELKAALKSAHKLDSSVRYGDYLDARKAAMLETLAEGNG